MIKSWQHKGLKRFYETGSTVGINAQHAKKISAILQLLDVADCPELLNIPGYGFHTLTGNLKGYFSVAVSGSWRIIFQFEGEHAVLVDYLNYH